MSNVVSIVAGDYQSLALRFDGTVAAWGNDSYGQGTVPAGLSNVVAIAAGVHRSLALQQLSVALPPPCTITCSTNIAVCNDPGHCGAVVRFPAPMATNCGGLVIACFPASGSFFPVGTNAMLCAAMDAAGLVTNTCSFEVTVQDCEPPVIWSIAASPEVLWTPNHGMEQVTVHVSAADNCHFAGCKIISVSSSQSVLAPRGGHTAPDWQITGDLTVDLRAERSATGTGRVYRITVECTDDSGNASTEVVQVIVPHDQRSH